jgi:hypothetical protein
METGQPEQGTQNLDKSEAEQRRANAGIPKARNPKNRKRAGASHGMRSCGTCAACCGGWLRLLVGDLIVDGAPCPHSTGHSCGIYDRRPTTCRDFACAWIKPESPIPSGFRPDKVGIIVLDNRLTWRDLPVDILVVAGTPKESIMSWYKKYAVKNNRLFLLQQQGLCSTFGPLEFLTEISARLEQGERLY